MIEILVSISGMEVGFDLARELGRSLAEKGDPETMLVAWEDKRNRKHSPSCVKCDIADEPGWLVYGRNHGGRLKIDVNAGEYVFIFS